ncbi:hypothetical protein DM02DRAFT_663473, partial [Periconia macrospinosa]
MRDRLIFSSVQDEDLRTALLANIINIPMLIPSLRTFFETLKHLEPLCDILKRLLGSKIKDTIRQDVLEYFLPPEKIRVQKSEGCYMEFKVSPERSQAADLAYAQLWAFCGRHLDGLTPFTPKKEISKDKPVTKGPNPALWQQLARFALDLGFHIPAAKELAAQDPVSQLAVDYLRKVNPLTANFSAQQIHAVINASSQATVQLENTVECSLTQVDVERRCGRPFELDLEEDRRMLFLPNIYADSGSTGVTLRFVRRNLFTCIFGRFHFPDDTFYSSVVSCAPSDPAPKKRRRVDDDREPTYPEEIIGELEVKLASSERAFVALRTANMELEERFRSLECRHAELLARQEVATENGREHTPTLDVEMTETALPENDRSRSTRRERRRTNSPGRDQVASELANNPLTSPNHPSHKQEQKYGHGGADDDKEWRERRRTNSPGRDQVASELADNPLISPNHPSHKQEQKYGHGGADDDKEYEVERILG